MTPENINQQAEISLPFNPREHYFSSDESVFVEDAFAAGIYDVDVRLQTSVYRGDKLPSGSRKGAVKGVDMWADIREGRESLAGALPITLGPVPAQTPEVRGEELFYSRELGSGTSCHDCHVHGHTNYQLADTLGDDTSNTPKRIPTLLGSRLTYPWAWNGKVSELDDQVRKSLETTLHVSAVTPQQVIDINAFLHTLEPPPPVQPVRDDPADRAQAARGKLLFETFGCVKCHMPDFTYTSPDVYDVGLQDEKGQRQFNPPSLCGVSQGYAFFHDGRAKTLEEVLSVYGHQLDRSLTDGELADLLRFLRSL